MSTTRWLAWLLVGVLVGGCAAGGAASASYFDNRGRDDVFSGGVKPIPITTSKGTFTVWTKRIGNNPRIKVLTLHGGPGATHEYFEMLDSFFPGEGIEYYYYDQLGSYYSDQPNDPALLDIGRYADEVEQVRVALGLDAQNFYLLGHSWGGMLAIEYALKYSKNLKGLIISNRMASIPAYNEYAHKVLMPAMDQTALAEILKIEAAKDTQNPRYLELLTPHHYQVHFLRLQAEKWPDGVNRAFKHLNYAVYVPMQGPSELGASGIIEKWDRFADLATIPVPTLVVGAQYDTMDPKYMEQMAKSLKRGRYLYCAHGSHMSMYDDQETWVRGVIGFLRDVDAGKL